MRCIFEDMASLNQAVLERLIKAAQHAVETQGRFSLVLSGGHTPQQLYQFLAQPDIQTQLPWTKTYVFWGDERCVAADDSQSNQHMAREALLSKVPIPSEQIYPIAYNQSPEESASQYEATLRQFFVGEVPQFDWIFLGLGENGHTASLFPNTPALAEQTRWAVPVLLSPAELDRITLTAPLINQAKVIAFLVEGSQKASVLSEILEGPKDTNRLPAQLIHPVDGEVFWFMDKAAAAKLPVAQHS